MPDLSFAIIDNRGMKAIMSDTPVDLVLEHLKRFQNSQERIERKLDELIGRVANLGGGQASVIQHLGNLAAADAQQQLSVDHANQRLDRIERRLELQV
jgi:hypothetical protein